MSLFGLPVVLLRKVLSRNAFLVTAGGFATRTLIKRKRTPWEKAKGKKLEAMLDRITTYEMARGAGKLLTGWLLYDNPELSAAAVDKRFRKLLAEMDKEDGAPEDRARNRFVLSKALFVLEGFHLSKGYYEDYQQQARYLIQKNPKWRTISRQDVFKGKSFEPESIIGATHRILLLLSNRQPYGYLADVLENATLRDDMDFFARLIALTFPAGEGAEPVQDADAQLGEAIYRWLEEYRDFKIGQANQQEAMLNTGIAAATGGLPAMAGMDLLGRVGKSIFNRRK
jgi:hypothetical protein